MKLECQDDDCRLKVNSIPRSVGQGQLTHKYSLTTILRITNCKWLFLVLIFILNPTRYLLLYLTSLAPLSLSLSPPPLCTNKIVLYTINILYTYNLSMYTLLITISQSLKMSNGDWFQMHFSSLKYHFYESPSKSSFYWIKYLEDVS